MNIFYRLVEIAENRVSEYGAQYNTFAILGFLNHILACLYELNVQSIGPSFFLRVVSAFLCFILLLKEKWPQNLKKFLPLYWFVTVMIAVPVVTMFILLQSDGSIGYLINFNIGVMILILLLDSLSFLAIQLLGSLIGFSLFYAIYNNINISFREDDWSLFLYMFFCITILGTVFSRNKEVYSSFLQKTKDEVNHHLQEKVKERTIELERALAIKTEFLNNMSHEIRTPIQGFLAISEGLELNWDGYKDTQRYRYIHEIAKNAKRLAALVTNILDFARFNEGKVVLFLSKFNINEAVEDIIDECKTLYMRDKNLQIVFESTDYSQENIADKERIYQVLRNLFFNAIKFSNEGDTITARLAFNKDDNKEVYFSISDQAVGIPEDEIDYIFAPFVQSSRTKTKAGGVGLGLAICREIIEAHNGKIWASNNKLKGATFHFKVYA